MLIAKRKLSVVASVIACLVIVATATATVIGWHGLSQSQRNSRIINRADNDIGDYTGQSCKEWVRDVVEDASDGLVTIPSTRSNNYQWYSHPYVAPCLHPFPINWVQPGQIIQMRWTNNNGTTTPHTAIVLSKTSSSMTWLDCNWQGDEVVRTHSMTFNYFNNHVGSYYTVYEIR